jgi:hypothetical protein
MASPEICLGTRQILNIKNPVVEAFYGICLWLKIGRRDAHLAKRICFRNVELNLMEWEN